MNCFANCATVTGPEVTQKLKVFCVEVELKFKAYLESCKLFTELVVIVHSVCTGGLLIAREGGGGRRGGS